MTARVENALRVEPFIPESDKQLAIRNITSMGSLLGILTAADALSSFYDDPYNEPGRTLRNAATAMALYLVTVSEIIKRQKAIQQMAREEDSSFEEATAIQWNALRFTFRLVHECFNQALGYLRWNHLEFDYNPGIIQISRYARRLENVTTLLDPLAEVPNVCVVAKRCFRRCREGYRTFRTSPGKALARAAVSLFNLACESLSMFVKVKNAYELLFPHSYVSAPSFYTETVITESESGPTVVTETTRQFNPAEEPLNLERFVEAQRERLTELFVEEQARPVPAGGIDLQAMENQTGLSLGLSLGEVRPEIHGPQPPTRLGLR